jgi:hypothetical protein
MLVGVDGLIAHNKENVADGKLVPCEFREYTMKSYV